MWLWLAASVCQCADRNMLQPTTPEVRYEGIVYIACHPGPYPINIDSLIAMCTSVIGDTLPGPGELVGCTYDELADALGADFHISLVRGQTLNTIDLGEVRDDPDVTEIPLTLGDTTYVAGEYPYYSGYLLEWPQRSLSVHAVNQWVGGCLHDLLIWEVIVQ